MRGSRAPARRPRQCPRPVAVSSAAAVLTAACWGCAQIPAGLLAGLLVGAASSTGAALLLRRRRTVHQSPAQGTVSVRAPAAGAGGLQDGLAGDRGPAPPLGPELDRARKGAERDRQLPPAR